MNVKKGPVREYRAKHTIKGEINESKSAVTGHNPPTHAETGACGKSSPGPIKKENRLFSIRCAYRFTTRKSLSCKASTASRLVTMPKLAWSGLK